MEKLNRLEVEGRTLLTSSQLDDLTDCYKFFLHQYHKSQATYGQIGCSSVKFDAKEVRERLNTLESICSSQIIVDPTTI